MGDVSIQRIDHEILIKYSGKKVTLPSSYRTEVDAYWNTLLQGGRKHFNGTVFTITNHQISHESIEILVDQTDYAHFLYTISNKTSSNHDCRVIYTSTLVITSDGYYVIGEMGTDTFAPQKLQLFGGGLDEQDVVGDIIDHRHSVEKELHEELGLDPSDKKIWSQLSPAFLKNGGKHDFLSVIYKAKLTLDHMVVQHRFDHHNTILRTTGIQPELRSLVFIRAVPQTILAFDKREIRERDENLIPAMMADVGIWPGMR